MINSDLMLVAERVIIDTESNRLTIFNLLEDLNVNQFPLFIPSLNVLNMLSKDDGDETILQCKLVLKLNDEELLNQPITLNFQNNRRNRSIVRIGGLMIPQSGKLLFEFYQNENLLATFLSILNITPIPRVQTQ